MRTVMAMTILWENSIKITKTKNRTVPATTCAPPSLTLGSNVARGTTVKMMTMLEDGSLFNAWWLWLLWWGFGGRKLRCQTTRWRWDDFRRWWWRLRLRRCAWQVHSLLWGAEERILQGLSLLPVNKGINIYSQGRVSWRGDSATGDRGDVITTPFDLHIHSQILFSNSHMIRWYVNSNIDTQALEEKTWREVITMPETISRFACGQSSWIYWLDEWSLILNIIDKNSNGQF